MQETMNDYQEPIRFLNKLTGRNFDWTKECHQRFLRARYNEGRTLEQIKRVIEVKCNQWKGTKMAMYLRPSTLLNRTKFENYYQEVDYVLYENKIGGFKTL